MFNLAIDSKLRGCDVVAIRVEDVAASGYTADRATVRQKKTGRRPVRFELSEQTRQAVDDYLKVANKRSGEFLFAGRRGAEGSMTTRQYARLYPNRLASWTSADVFTPTITPPASVLCRIRRDDLHDHRKSPCRSRSLRLRLRIWPRPPSELEYRRHRIPACLPAPSDSCVYPP